MRGAGPEGSWAELGPAGAGRRGGLGLYLRLRGKVVEGPGLGLGERKEDGPVSPRSELGPLGFVQAESRRDPSAGIWTDVWE